MSKYLENLINVLTSEKEQWDSICRDTFYENSILRKFYKNASIGCQNCNEKGVFNLQTDSDGSWSVERFKGLVYAIEHDINSFNVDAKLVDIIIVTSANLASALIMSGLVTTNLNSDNKSSINDSNSLIFVGAITNSIIPVFVDKNLTNNYYFIIDTQTGKSIKSKVVGL